MFVPKYTAKYADGSFSITPLTSVLLDIQNYNKHRVYHDPKMSV